MRKFFSISRAISLLSILLSITCGCFGVSKRLVPETAFYTKDELSSLFYENKELFSEVADIVLSSDKLKEYMLEIGDGDFGINATYDKRFFSDNNWKKILQFSKSVSFDFLTKSLLNCMLKSTRVLRFLIRQ